MGDLESLYTSWAVNDPIFNRISVDYPGVRMLRQDPVENLFSFICSANNNIARISGMVENLCQEYGDFVGEWEGIQYNSFPSLEILSQEGVEQRLRELGFGYRAKYIQQSAEKIIKLGGEQWLYSLRGQDYVDAKKSLLQLSGIGPKVADCILLMSLDQPESIPVDTHMFTIAKRYLPHLNQYKSLTDRIYKEIADYFRSLYGNYAGWAHSVLFSADLRHLQELKTDKEELSLKTESENILISENLDPANNIVTNTFAMSGKASPEKMLKSSKRKDETSKLPSPVKMKKH